MHTATHLLGAALHEVLGDHVHQRASNITEQRLRFDFSHPEPLTDEQLARVQDVVDGWIADGVEVERL
jgi:alanyl-tRNA synthetase